MTKLEGFVRSATSVVYPAGDLLTGLWTLLVAASILSTAVLPGWLGLIGLPIGVALLVGSLEFVGPNEGRLAAGGDDRADRLHRLVALAHRSGRVPAAVNECLRVACSAPSWADR